ncbi:NAD(P)/FAD-dependent oxidoreductase [Aeromicrobium sp. P5_D10]
MTTLEVDVAIIGAGPSGLYAAYYAGFRGLKTALIDSLPEVGGQIAALYPEKAIFDVAGFPSIRGQDFVDGLHTQAKRWGPEILLESQAVGLEETAEHVTITLSDGRQVRAAALLITAGIGTFEPRQLPTGSDFEGRGLRYFVPKLNELAGQDVVIVGGGDSAVDWALALEDVAASVTLVHRRPAFRAHERSVEQLMDSTVTILTPYEVDALVGEDQLTTVVASSKDGDVKHLPAQTVVAALGFIADLGPMEQWGLELHRRHIVVDRTQRTNRERVFAAGDVTHFEGKVKLISIGFGEAALAINHMARLIDPTSALNPGHSTDG